MLGGRVYLKFELLVLTLYLVHDFMQLVHLLSQSVVL